MNALSDPNKADWEVALVKYILISIVFFTWLNEGLMIIDSSLVKIT